MIKQACKIIPKCCIPTTILNSELFSVFVVNLYNYTNYTNFSTKFNIDIYLNCFVYPFMYLL